MEEHHASRNPDRRPALARGGRSRLGPDPRLYENSVNGYALNAAEFVRPGEVVHATAADFGTLLDSQEWELVVMDFPSNEPDSGVGPLIDYATNGGLVILSTWFGIYDQNPGLFGALAPRAAPASHWAPTSSIPQARRPRVPSSMVCPCPGSTGDASGQVTILANDGRTIATLLIDVWDGSTEAERVWENMMNLVLGGRPRAAQTWTWTAA